MARMFTPQEDAFIKANYDKITSGDIGKEIDRQPSVIRLRAKRLGLQVPAEKLEEFKNKSRFKKSHVPFSKGKKREEFMTAEAIALHAANWFKKGQKAHNEKNDGEITIRNNRQNVPIYHIRLQANCWVPLHRHIWEQHNGPIPPLHNVVFKDGNTMNCIIENLELLSNEELMKRNTIHNLPPEIKEVINIGKSLNNKIKKTLKLLQDE